MTRWEQRQDGRAADGEAIRREVLARLAIAGARVAVATGVRRAGDPRPDDRNRGLYLTEAHVERLLDDGAPLAFVPGEPWPVLEGGALRALGCRLGCDAVDLDLLIVAVAPDLDPRFEQLYGYLHDDITRRRASVALALRLVGRDLADPGERARLSSESPLVRRGVVTIEDADRPFLTRALRVPDRVVAALLGDERADPLLVPLVVPAVTIASEIPTRLAPLLEQPDALVYLQEAAGGTARHVAAAALELTERRAVCLDLARVAAPDVAAAIAAAHREALLLGGGLVAGPIDGLATIDAPALHALVDSSEPILLHGTMRWEPDWSPRMPLLVDAPSLDPTERARLWNRALDATTSDAVDPGAATVAFRLGPDHVVRAAQAARLLASYHGRPVGIDDLHAGARSQNSAGLQRLAGRIVPSAGWDELILPPEPLELLGELVARIRFREQVLDGMKMRRGAGRGEGCTALFAGPSGTGKTLAAEVVAHDLGFDLYTVDLATVVDKYIGETEKNLDRIFAEAERVNGVLFFDEADALFGKRSEVKDARDRYANVEVAYLLQRMERFSGLAILATNLRANLDEAFARRLDVVVDFPQPDAEYRLKLWEHCLAPATPHAAELDLAFCATAFDFSGGNIRNVAVTAAYLAVAEGVPIDTSHLIKAVQREYRKLGRLTVPAEFGAYFALIEAG